MHTRHGVLALLVFCSALLLAKTAMAENCPDCGAKAPQKLLPLTSPDVCDAAATTAMSEERIEHLHKAADHLQAAGLSEEAELVRTRAQHERRTWRRKLLSQKMAQLHALQDEIQIKQASPGKLEFPDWEMTSFLQTRKDLNLLAAGLSDVSDGFGKRGQVDPIAHLGEYWFLGKIYFWITTSLAWHFDIPLWNYFGWLLTCFCIVYANVLIDKWLFSKGVDYKPAFNLPHRPLWSLGYYIGNFLFILAVNIYLYLNPAVPPEKQVGLILANTVVFIVAFVVFNVVVIKRKLQA